MKRLLFFWLLCFSFPTFSMVVSEEAIQSQLAAAILVGEIIVESKESRPDEVQFARTLSRARLTRRESIKSDGQWLPEVGDSFWLQSPGGEIAGTGVMLSGYPRPQVGMSYKVFLKRFENDIFEVAGLEFGLRPLVSQRKYSRNRTDGSNGQGDGAFLYWDNKFFPIPYFISFPTFRNYAEFVPLIDDSFGTWATPQNSRIDFVGMGCTNVTRNENDGINAVIFVTDNWLFDSAAIAITRNFYIAGNSAHSGMVLDSDILINGVDHVFSTSGESGKHDMQNIVTHEVGHFIGFGHEISPLDPDATMLAVASPGETKKRQLHNSELVGLADAYGGVSSGKLTTARPSCQVISAPLGCAAVHDKQPPSLMSLLYVILYLVVTIFLGRKITSTASSLVLLWRSKNS